MISFPEPGLAGDQDRQIRWPDPPRHRVDLTHPRGNEQVALEHQPLFDGPERGSVTSHLAAIWLVRQQPQRLTSPHKRPPARPDHRTCKSASGAAHRRRRLERRLSSGTLRASAPGLWRSKNVRRDPRGPATTRMRHALRSTPIASAASRPRSLGCPPAQGEWLRWLRRNRHPPRHWLRHRTECACSGLCPAKILPNPCSAGELYLRPKRSPLERASSPASQCTSPRRPTSVASAESNEIIERSPSAHEVAESDRQHSSSLAPIRPGDTSHRAFRQAAASPGGVPSPPRTCLRRIRA